MQVLLLVTSLPVDKAFTLVVLLLTGFLLLIPLLQNGTWTRQR